MIVDLCYVYPAVASRIYRPLADRFVNSYINFPPGGHDHRLTIIVNGGNKGAIKNYEQVFQNIGCTIRFHDNCGKDIGAFQSFAVESKADLLVCLGAPVHFHRAGWLDRIVRAYEDNGPGLYGAWGFHEPRDHIRTTAFWLPPQLLNSYPFQVIDATRYEFEHGRNSICSFTKRMGMECYMVAWDGCYPCAEWRHLNLDQMLMLDQHTQRNGIG